jgi:hypothetical protein
MCSASTVMCESVSLRCSLVIKQVWSSDPGVHGELIWSRVSPNRAPVIIISGWPQSKVEQTVVGQMSL